MISASFTHRSNDTIWTKLDVQSLLKLFLLHKKNQLLMFNKDTIKWYYLHLKLLKEIPREKKQTHWRLQSSRKFTLAMGHSVNMQATGLITSSKQIFEEKVSHILAWQEISYKHQLHIIIIRQYVSGRFISGNTNQTSGQMQTPYSAIDSP